MLWIAERDPGFTFTEKKALTPEQHRILNFGGDIKDPTVEVPPLVRKVIEHAKMAKYKKGRTEIWKAKMAVLNKETVAERQRKHRGWKKERDERRSSETPLERVRQESLEKEKGKPEEPWRVRESVRAWRAETGRAWESGMIQNKREWEQRMVRRMGPSAIPEGERKQVPRYTKESEFAIERAMVKRKKAKRAAAARASNPTGDYARESRPFTPQGDMRPVAYRKLEIGRK